MKLALAPTNPTIGDLPGNADLVIAAIDHARSTGADLIVVPELAICGYPPKDLLWQNGFVDAAMEQLNRVAAAACGIVAIVGCPWRASSNAIIYNSLLVLRDGEVAGRYDKRLLPTYDVFDEDRYFTPADQPLVIEVAGLQVGLAICEDLWHGDDAGFASQYHDRPDPVTELVAAGAKLIVCPSGSPFVLGKCHVQHDIITAHVRKHSVALASLNQFGANDELLFDGQAMVHVPARDNQAELLAATTPFSGDTLIVEIDADTEAPAATVDPCGSLHNEALLWKALTLGVRDYVRKIGFCEVALGLSGGIDSAVAAVVAVGALGPDRVLTVGMPSRYSSPGSITDAQELAGAVGARFITAPITAMHDVAEAELQPIFKTLNAPTEPGVAEENIQARLRGLILMALSNKLGSLLLTTGNKSELAVGYCTLYGDMNGGLAVLSDVSKTLVYRLARWINANYEECGFQSPPIPVSTIEKPPSAELRSDQRDQDSLPPYDVLDEIIERYVEQRQSPSQIATEIGADRELVLRIVTMIDTSEYKRKQASIGLKITSVAFGSGRRFPIAQRWRHV
jgi:NAD+ synthase (glutamine-hydrolysing)